MGKECPRSHLTDRASLEKLLAAALRGRDAAFIAQEPHILRVERPPQWLQKQGVTQLDLAVDRELIPRLVSMIGDGKRLSLATPMANITLVVPRDSTYETM